MQPKEKPAHDAGKTWSGRFSEPVAELVKRYTASVDFDKRLELFPNDGADCDGVLQMPMTSEADNPDRR